ncbi:MAG: hypothetical protein CVV45_00700 [Spirochaetae bacterium HGW-Spirochaetae-10]|nr:MAG: hypothetical protein CVV45_00700 [Spirochaetae bacterium HGW-Spirochaetae-10]
MFVMNHELKFHTTKLGELRSNLKSTKETEQRIASLRTKLDAVLQKERLYGILREGPGQKGARALLIDSAWPAISASINDILADTFGPRFQVKIKTQRAAGNGPLREAMEILVYVTRKKSLPTLRINQAENRLASKKRSPRHRPV